MRSNVEGICSMACEEAGEYCDLCLAQQRTKQVRDDLANGKPTLRHQPFKALLTESTCPACDVMTTCSRHR